MNLHVSNLDSAVDNEQLTQLFAAYGGVDSAEVVYDDFNGLSRGFAYVEMADEQEANEAIKQLNNSMLNGIPVLVKEAAPTHEQKGSYKVGSGVVNAYRFRKN